MDITCPKCAARVPETALACTSCGHSFMVELPPSSVSPSALPTGPASVGGGAGQGAGSGSATIAVVFSAIGLLFVPLAVVGLLLGVAASRRIAATPGSQGSSAAQAAVIIGMVSIGLWSLYFLRMLHLLGYL